MYKILLITAVLIVQTVYAQIPLRRDLNHLESVTTTPLLPSNSVSHIAIQDSAMYIGTGTGLAKSTDGGKIWISYRSDTSFATNGIFAIATHGNTVWAATGYTTKDGENEIQTGSGYAFSIDGGATWNHALQPLDSCIELSSASGKRICQNFRTVRYGDLNDSVKVTAVTTPVANVSYDVALTDNTVWVASWSSSLRKSTDNGATWEQVLLPLDGMNSISELDTLWYFAASDTAHTDTLYQYFDVVKNDNLKAFSVLAVNNDDIWCGTAGGVNHSIDGGRSWTKFCHRNQASPILGNWVIAIREQNFGTTHRIWITNWTGDTSIDPDQDYGISYTEDNGTTWKNFLYGVRAYDFAFKDSIAYIATDEGLFRTADGGATFQHIANGITLVGGPLAVNNIVAAYDSSNRQVIASSSFLCAGVIGDSVYLGSDDGLARTIDNAESSFGSIWNIYRTYDQLGTAKSTYAYPNPFSPAYEIVRIHYGATDLASTGDRTVSIDIFDFSMTRVRTLLHDAVRSASMEYDELWDARDYNGNVVANGVYFYRLKINDDEPIYGKILVIQ
jgi:photosystem II stability/assembly factor-like uncharacterized protein